MDPGVPRGAVREDRLHDDDGCPVAGTGSPRGMTEETTSSHGPPERGSQRGEAAPEASSPFLDADAEQSDAEGRDVEQDVEDNADLDG